MMKAAFILPTNNPKLFSEYILSSIKHVEVLKDSVKWLILLQPPFPRDSVDKYKLGLTINGWNAEVSFGEGWTKPINILDIRSTCAEIDTTVDFYISLDDDMRFAPRTAKYDRSSGQRLLEALAYMEQFPRCAGMDCRGFLGGTGTGYRIAPVWNWCHTMGVGMIFRNMTKTHGFALTPPEARHLAGNHDETLNAHVRIERGYYWALQRNVPTYHKTGTNDVSYDLPADHWQNKAVIDANVRAWIRERYNAHKWEHSPSYKKCAVPYDLYLKNGGPDVLDKEVAKKMTVEF